jgi:hypothetical protein
MTRLERFKALEHHAWLKKSYAKLSKSEIALGEKIMAENETTDKNELASMILRLWLDKPKPKGWIYLEELLIASI